MLLQQDESWFSRFAQPWVQIIAEQNHPLRLVDRTASAKEPNKALACFGTVCHTSKERWMYFPEGQPSGALILLMLQALLVITLEKVKRVLVVFWEQVSWNKSRKLIHWVWKHNRRSNAAGKECDC